MNQSNNDMQDSDQTTITLSKNIKTIDVIPNIFQVNFSPQGYNLNIYFYTFKITPQIQVSDSVLRHKLLNIGKSYIKKYRLPPFYVTYEMIWSFSLTNNGLCFTIQLDSIYYAIQCENINITNLSNIKGIKCFKCQKLMKQALSIILKKNFKQLGYNAYNKFTEYYKPLQNNINQNDDKQVEIREGFNIELKYNLQNMSLLIHYNPKLISTQTVLEYIEQNKINNLESFFKNLIVIKSYGSNKIQRVLGINLKVNPNTQFSFHKQQISFNEYYKTKYNITIKDQKQPLLISKNTKRQYTLLIPELLYFAEFNSEQKEDKKIQQAINQIAKQKTNTFHIINQLKDQLNQHLLNNNIQLQDAQNIQAYLLPMKYVFNQQNQKLKIDQQLKKIKLINKDNQPFKIHDWIIISHKDNWEITDKLIDSLIYQGKNMNIEIREPYIIELDQYTPQNWIDQLHKNTRPKPQLIVSLTKEQDAILQTSLKTFCFQQCGVPYQNISIEICNNKKLNKNCLRIIQQIYVKLGNPLWIIPPIKIMSNNIIIIGIDVYPKVSLFNKQYQIGFVAHFDKQCKSCYSEIIHTFNSQNIIRDLGNVLIKTISEYQEYHKNQQLPDTIIVYRNGIDNFKVEMSIDIEINQFQRQIKNIYKDKLPQFAFIYINKRISQSFCIKGDSNQQQTQYDNCLSGTILRNGEQQNIEFYLISQNSLGTSIPTLYRVLYNSTNWSEQMFWQFTYNQCFNYQNLDGPISVPACVQYAYNLSYLSSQIIGFNPSYSVKNQLYYI